MALFPSRQRGRRRRARRGSHRGRQWFARRPGGRRGLDCVPSGSTAICSGRCVTFRKRWTVKSAATPTSPPDDPRADPRLAEFHALPMSLQMRALGDLAAKMRGWADRWEAEDRLHSVDGDLVDACPDHVGGAAETGATNGWPMPKTQTSETIRPPIPATCESPPTIGGLVIPWINVQLADGGVDFAAQHDSRAQRCYLECLCQACSAPIERPRHVHERCLSSARLRTRSGRPRTWTSEVTAQRCEI